MAFPSPYPEHRTDSPKFASARSWVGRPLCGLPPVFAFRQTDRPPNGGRLRKYFYLNTEADERRCECRP